MKTLRSILALCALVLSPYLLAAQSGGVLSISTSPTATTADYDKVVAALKAKGLWEMYWSFHAMATAQPAGLFSLGIFPNRDAFNKRMEAVQPVFAQAGAKPNVQVYDIYNSFMGVVPATSPATGIVVHFDAAGMTAAQYDQILVELKKVMSFPPPGQISHVCYKTDDGLRVIDVWESPEAFAAMGEKLMPILQNLGVNTGPPIIYSLYNFLKTSN